MRTHPRLATAAALLTLALPRAGAAEAPAAKQAPLSDETQTCIMCHESLMPGLVADWRNSRHARMTVAEALKAKAPERRISTDQVPKAYRDVAVGCFECHGDKKGDPAHADSFDHQGYRIHVVVTPNDCDTCHPAEVKEYAGTKKALALKNFRQNPLFDLLVRTSTSTVEVEGTHLTLGDSPLEVRNDSCYGCHGTPVTVDGMKTVDSDFGEVEVPNLVGWPNHGVGRVNPDGSRGACSSCHARHAFDIEVARKPYTCAQCHLDPDVPAWNVWRESKHGNITLSQGDDFTWDAVPWVPGRDFRAPSCAACHVAGLAAPDGTVVAERTHDFGARLWVRIFGLPYAVAQPRKGDTTLIRNADGLPLPSTFVGVPASEYLIDEKAQQARKAEMTGVCSACHGATYADHFFEKLDVTIAKTNEMTAAATQLLEAGRKVGLAGGDNPFDEDLELKWVNQWLFYANSIRYGSAMSGPDYAAFKNGWYKMAHGVRQMQHMVEEAQKIEEARKVGAVDASGSTSPSVSDTVH